MIFYRAGSTVVLIFLRHGNVDSDKSVEDFDTKISSSGREQIFRASCILKQYAPFHMLYTSPYRRTLESSDIIAESINIIPTVLEDLKEVSRKSILSDKSSAKYIFDKTVLILNRLADEARNSNIVIVGHCIFFSVWICKILDAHPFDTWFMNVIDYKNPLYLIDKGSISTIISNGQNLNFGLLNYPGKALTVKEALL